MSVTSGSASARKRLQSGRHHIDIVHRSPFAHQFGSFHQAWNDGSIAASTSSRMKPLGGATYVKRPSPDSGACCAATRVQPGTQQPVGLGDDVVHPHADMVHTRRPVRIPDAARGALEELEVLRTSCRIGEPKGHAPQAGLWRPDRLLSLARSRPSHAEGIGRSSAIALSRSVTRMPVWNSRWKSITAPCPARILIRQLILAHA